MKIGKRDFQTSGHTYIMGILNLTPDSFSDGGKWIRHDAALSHVEEMLREGMDILDIGGESTRPGHTRISAEEELERVIPVIRKIKSEFDIPLSLDTYKSEVARAGIAEGVDLINDIWGLKWDFACGDGEKETQGRRNKMAAVIAEGKAACCLMHNRLQPDYKNLLGDMAADLMESIRIAGEAGIDRDRIILDPGVGFGKSYRDNLEVIRHLDRFTGLGFPVLLGCSRKSVIGQTLDLPSDQRIEGTLVTTVMAVLSGCSFVRVHDVKENYRAIRMAEAIMEED